MVILNFSPEQEERLRSAGKIKADVFVKIVSSSFAHQCVYLKLTLQKLEFSVALNDVIVLRKMEQKIQGQLRLYGEIAMQTFSNLVCNRNRSY